MRTFIDNLLLQKLVASEGEERALSGWEAFLKESLLEKEEEVHLTFGWPSLLEYLGLGDILKKIPKFDENNPLFISLILAVIENPDQKELNDLFDQIFVECLTEVKDLPELHPTLLLEKLVEKRKAHSHAFTERCLGRTLEAYERRLGTDPSDAGHDLILHLAWDRVCNRYATFFDDLIPTAENQKSLSTLRECLTESFYHINGKGRTAPGFFRFMEALYLSFLKSEKTLKEEEFQTFSTLRASDILKSDEELADVFYIDTASIGMNSTRPNCRNDSEEGVRAFTLDTPEKVTQRLALAQETIHQLTTHFPGWDLSLCPCEVVCLEEKEKEVVVKAILKPHLN